MKPGVRVTGGAFRGRGLAVPASARPTEGRVREALFSIWADRLDRCRFLDLFAGSGVVGVEAASRGALHVLCVDQDLEAVRIIAANAVRLGEALLATRRLTLPAGLSRLAAEAAAGGVGAAGAAGGGLFDLAFADPPYRYDAYEALLVAVHPLLAAGGEAAVEHSSRHTLPPTAGPLVRTDSRRYGESSLSFYRAPE
jgi:16S rRNA (guanine966-N2)-methyltransferase